MNRRIFGKTSSGAHRLDVPKLDQQKEFLRQTAAILEIEFPGEYIERGTILTLLNSTDEICGGAIVVSEPPFRSLEGIPGNRDWSKIGSEKTIAEVNGVWLSSALKSPYLSFAFWQQLVSFLAHTKKQQFLFTFDNSNNRMRDFAAWLQPEILYSGKTKKLSGMKSSSDETIAIVSRESLLNLQAMLDRRNGGAANSNQEVKIIQRLEKRNKRDAGSPQFVRANKS